MIVVATDDFEVYHGVVNELRDRGVTFTTVEPDDDLPDGTSVVVAAESDDPPVPGNAPLVTVDPDDPRRAVDEVLAVLRGGSGRTVVGVDPGDRPGIAVLSGEMVVAAFTVPLADAADVVREEVQEAVDPLVRVGDGARLQGAKVIDDLETVPVELVDGALQELGTERSRADRLAHLHRLAELTSGPRLDAYWQEVAERVFLARLGPAVGYSTGSSVLSNLRSPTRLLRKDGTWDADRRQRELLVLLNVTRNESLRSVLTTALEVRTGDVADRRTPEIRAEARELLERTAEEPMYGRPHEARSLFEALLGRLRREGRGSVDAVRTRLPSIR